MALLYDAYGQEVYAGGVTRDAIREAVEAAVLAAEWQIATDIVDRYDLHGVCVACVSAPATTYISDTKSASRWRVCEPCEEKHRPVGIGFGDVQIMLHGLISRTVV